MKITAVFLLTLLVARVHAGGQPFFSAGLGYNVHGDTLRTSELNEGPLGIVRLGWKTDHIAAGYLHVSDPSVRDYGLNAIFVEYQWEKK